MKKMKELLKNKKGISLTILAVTIAIMIIIVSAITFSITRVGTSKEVDNLYVELGMLKDKVNTYYWKYGKLPVTTVYDKTQLTIPNDVINENDYGEYYYIDVSALENVSNIDTSKDYIINEGSHTIYAADGVEVEGETYYRLPEEYTKVSAELTANYLVKNDGLNAKIIVNAEQLIDGIKSIQFGNNTPKTYNPNTKIAEEEYLVEKDGTYTITVISNIGETKTISVKVELGEKYTVAFNANGGTGEMTDQTGFVAGKLKTLSASQFTRIGYNFAGWNEDQTKANEGVVEYRDKAKVKNLTITNGISTLYAVWEPKELIFEDKMITKEHSENAQTDTITPASNGTGTYTYRKVSEKNHAGTGTNFISVSGTTITIKEGTPGGTYTCVIEAKDAESLVTKKAKYIIEITRLNNTLQVLAKTGLIYTGVAQELVTVENAEGDVYFSVGTELTGDNFNQAGSTTIPSAINPGNYTVYYYTPGNDNYGVKSGHVNVIIDSVYQIAFNNNTGTGTMASLTGIKFSETRTLPANTFTKIGYTFDGWNTAANGTGTSYADKAEVTGLSNTNGETVTLYAKWKANTNTAYTVYHYTKDLGANTYTLADTENKTGTSDATITLASQAKTIEGFTYARGSLSVNGANATNTTIAPDGSRKIYLYYTRNSFAVTVNKDAGINAVTGAGTYEFGAEVSLGYTLKTGYTFAGWTGIQVTNNKFTMPNNAVTVTATTTENSYTIAFNNNTGSGTMSSLSNVKYTETKTLPANTFTKTGYTFVKWNTEANGSGTDYANEAKVTGLTQTNGATVTLYAQWTPNKYRITLNNQNATTAGTESAWYYYKTTKRINNVTVYYYSDEACTAPLSNGYNIVLPTKVGYTFGGYYTEANGAGTQYVNASGSFVNNIYSNVANNTTLYAKWTPNTNTAYTVNHYKHAYGSNTYTLDSTDNLTGTTDATLTVSNLTKTITGFTYVDAYLTGNTTKPTSGAITETTIAPDGSRIINLYYRPNHLYIQYDMNGGSLSSSHGSAYGASGTLLTNTANNPATSFLRGFYGSKVGSSNTTTYATATTDGLHNYNSTSGINVVRTGYTGKTNAQWNTKADGTGTSYNHSTTSYTAVSMASACGVDLSTGDKTITLYVNWTPVNYTVTYNLDGGTNAAGNPNTYNIETNTITLVDPSKTGYTFTGWTTNGVTTPTKNLQIIKGSTGNKTYTAHWTANTYTISFNANGGTGGQSANVTATYDAQMPAISTTAPTRAGYTFEGWFDDATNGTQYYTAAGASAKNYDKTANTTLYAHWTANTYTISFNSNSGTGTMANESMTYDIEKALTKNAFAKAGYTFAGWSTSASDINVVYDNAEYSKDNTSGSTYVNIKQYTIPAPFAAGDVYQLEVDAKGSGQLISYFYGATNYLKVASWTNSNGQSGTGTDGNNTIPITSEYSHYTVRFTLGNSGDGEVDKYLLFRAWTGCNASIKNVRFYKVSSTSTAYIDEQTVKNLATSGTVNLHAIWNENTYSISYNANEGTLTSNPSSYTVNTNTITLNNPSKTGYTFAGWTEEISNFTWTKGFININTGAFEPNNTSYPNSYYTELIRLRNGETYTLSGYGSYNAGHIRWRLFDLNGSYIGNGPSSNTYTATADCYVRIMLYNAPTEEQKAGTKATVGAKTTVTIPKGSTGNRNYVANWTANTYTLTLNNQGATTAGTAAVYYKFDTNKYYSNNTLQTEITTITKPEKNGYTFAGYYTEANGAGTQYIDANGAFVNDAYKNITSNTTLYAKWDVNPYYLTYDYQDNFEYSGEKALDTGYKVDWSKNFKIESKFKVAEVGRRYSIFSNYQTDLQTVGMELTTANKLRIWIGNGNTTSYADDKSSSSVAVGTEITATFEWNAETNTYTATATGTNTNISMTKRIATDMTGIASRNIFVGRDYRTTTFGPIQISMFKITDTVDYATVISTLPTVAKTGFTYNGWFDSATGGSKVTSVTMPAENKTLYAQWTPNKYRITLNNQNATTAGTESAWYYYKTTKRINNVTVYYYSDEACTAPLSNGYNIVLPTKVGYTFGGYYTEANGAGTQYVNASGSFVNNIYSNVANNTTLYAKWTPNTNTAYVVNHYVHDLGTNTYTLNGTDNLTGTSDASLTLANLVKTIEGFTYEAGYLTGSTAKPADGAVTETTIAPDGSRVINLYYRRNYLYIEYDANGGTISSGSFHLEGTLMATSSGTTRYCRGVYGSTVNEVTLPQYTTNTNGLHNVATFNVTRAGYTTAAGSAWRDSAGNPYSQTKKNYAANTFAGADLTQGDQVVRLYVNWTPVSYTITYNLDGGTNGAGNPSTYNIESNTITLADPTKAGYTFTGWTTDGVTTPTKNLQIQTGSYGNKTITANWVDNIAPEASLNTTATLKSTTQTATLTATDVSGVASYYWGTTSPTASSTYTTIDGPTANFSVTKEITAAGTYYFVAKDAFGNASTVQSVIIRSYAVQSILEKATATATAKTSTNYATSGSSVTYYAPSGTVITLEDVYTIPEGAAANTFQGYSTATVSTTARTLSKVAPTLTANATYYMWFNRVTYTLTLNTGTGISTVTGAGTHKHGKSVSISSTANTGYSFSTWQVNSGSIPASLTTNSTTVTITEDTVLTAVGAPITYTIAYSLTSGTAGEKAPTSGTYDANVEISNPTRPGYTFAGWTASSLTTSTAKYGTTANDVTTSWSSGSTKVTATFFKNLTTTNNGTVTLTATWTANTYNVGYELNGGTAGTYAPTSGTYASNVRISNPTKTGYTFAGWTATGVGPNAVTGTSTTPSTAWNGTTATTNQYYKNLTDTSGGTVTFIANWTENTYKIAFSANLGTGTMTTIENVAYTANVTLPACTFTRDGYTFEGWASSSSGNVVYADEATVSSLSSTNNATVRLYAKWKAIPKLVAQSSGSTANFLGNTGTTASITKANIEKVTFVSTGIDGHSASDSNCWDASTTKDGSILAWYADEDEDSKYEVTIGSIAGKVKANVNSSYLFAYIGNNLSASIEGLSNLDTSSVTHMSYMFERCSSLTSLDVSGFDTSSVKNMSYMFDWCSGLTGLDVSGLDTSSVTNMNRMFEGCSSLTSLDVSGFDTSSVTDMACMFRFCSSLTSLDVRGFDTSSVESMSYMFDGCSGLTSLDVSGIDTSSVTNMYSMFCDCSGLTSLDVSGFDTSSVTNMYEMFENCSGLTSLDVSGFDTSSVTNMYSMFNNCSGLTSLDVSGFDTSSVTDMGNMFSRCETLTSLDVSGFDTSSVTNMSEMFGGCSSLTSLDLSGFDTSSVTNMSSMFNYCRSLTSLDVSGFETSEVTSMYWMFKECSILTSLDLSGFDTSSVTNMGYMFYRCSSVTTIYVGDNWNTSMVGQSSNMFNNCIKLVGGAGTTYNSSKKDKTYARIDNPPDEPGYLTYKAPTP